MISNQIWGGVINKSLNSSDFTELDTILKESKSGEKDYGLTSTDISNIEELLIWSPSYNKQNRENYEVIENRIKEYFSQEGNNVKFAAGEWDHVARFFDFETGEMCEKIVKIPHDSLDEEIEKIRKVPFEDLERKRDGWSDFEVKDWRNEWEVKTYLEECDESWITPDIMLRAYEMMRNC